MSRCFLGAPFGQPVGHTSQLPDHAPLSQLLRCSPPSPPELARAAPGLAGAAAGASEGAMPRARCWRAVGFLLGRTVNRSSYVGVGWERSTVWSQNGNPAVHPVSLMLVSWTRRDGEEPFSVARVVDLDICWPKSTHVVLTDGVPVTVSLHCGLRSFCRTRIYTHPD